MPYPPSQVITGVLFNNASIRTLAGGSDNWPISWAPDGHQYTTWGDGSGFGTSDSTRVSIGMGRVEGDKNNYIGVNIAGGNNAPCPAPFTGKSEGILALGNSLYLWRNGDGSNTDAFRFSELRRSDDLACTWPFTGVVFSKTGGDFTGTDEGFFSLTFLQFGQGYTATRDNYVYMYAPEIIDRSHWNVQKPGRIALVRVDRALIEQKAAYEFFTGLDINGNPTWTNVIAARRPVWEDPNGTHRMSASYNAALNRYLLTTMTVDRIGRFSLYDAPEPWGPWTLVLNEQNTTRWGSNVIAYHFSNKWLSPDGKSFVIVYTKDDRWATIEGSFIAMTPPGPLASFLASPVEGPAPLAVTFTDQSSP